MSDLFLKILNFSINASWLILVVLALRLLFKKAPKWIFCVLWGLVAIRLICPFTIKSILSLLPSSEVIPQNIALAQKPVINTGITFINNTVNPVISGTFAPEPASSVNPLQVITAIAAAAWVAGMAAMVIYLLASYIRLKMKVRISIPIDDQIRSCDEIRSPFILGLFRPVIYVPSSVNGKALDFVISHEKAHLQRRDHLWKPLGFLLLTVYWFNPLCWLAYILLCRDIEAACDEKVIREKDKEYIADYSQTLLDLSVPGKMISACPLAFGETGVKSRVKGVLNYKKPAFWLILVAVLSCIAAGVCFLTDPVSATDSDLTEDTALTTDSSSTADAVSITDSDLSADTELTTDPTSATDSGSTADPASGISMEELAMKMDHVGVYYYSENVVDGKTIIDFSITLEADGTFTYYETPYSSFIGTGKYVIEDGILTLMNDEEMTGNTDVNRFRVEGDKLYFIAEGSANFHTARLDDGAEFIYGVNPIAGWMEQPLPGQTIFYEDTDYTGWQDSLLDGAGPWEYRFCDDDIYLQNGWYVDSVTITPGSILMICCNPEYTGSNDFRKQGTCQATGLLLTDGRQIDCYTAQTEWITEGESSKVIQKQSIVLSEEIDPDAIEAVCISIWDPKSGDYSANVVKLELSFEEITAQSFLAEEAVLCDIDQLTVLLTRFAYIPSEHTYSIQLKMQNHTETGLEMSGIGILMNGLVFPRPVMNTMLSGQEMTLELVLSEEEVLEAGIDHLQRIGIVLEIDLEGTPIGIEWTQDVSGDGISVQGDSSTDPASALGESSADPASVQGDSSADPVSVQGDSSTDQSSGLDGTSSDLASALEGSSSDLASELEETYSDFASVLEAISSDPAPVPEPDDVREAFLSWLFTSNQDNRLIIYQLELILSMYQYVNDNPTTAQDNAVESPEEVPYGIVELDPDLLAIEEAAVARYYNPIAGFTSEELIRQMTSNMTPMNSDKMYVDGEAEMKFVDVTFGEGREDPFVSGMIYDFDARVTVDGYEHLQNFSYTLGEDGYFHMTGQITVDDGIITSYYVAGSKTIVK